MDRRVTLKEALRLELKETLLLFALRHWGPMGRGRLEEVLGLPEGIVRGLLRRAQMAGWVKAGRAGCSITEAGKRALDESLAKMGISSAAMVSGEGLGVGPLSYGVLVSRGAEKVRLGIEQRDAAVRAGAKGVVSLTYMDGRLGIPGVCKDMASSMPEATRVLSSAFRLKEGDLLLVAFADDLWRAIEGAFSAALSVGSLCYERKHGS